MSVRSFRSVFMVGGVAAAALGCYLVSLRVASERAALESVETEIVLAQRDIRLLQTEIGTRGRLAQLERWNVKVLALSAPSADQFVPDGFQLARLATPERQLNVEAPVVYASAPAAVAPDVLSQTEEQSSRAPARLMHEASLKLPAARNARDKPAVVKAAPASDQAERPKPAATSTAKKDVPAKPVATTVAKKPSAETAKPKAKPVKLALADPLAPLGPAKKKAVPAARITSSTSKDSGKAR